MSVERQVDLLNSLAKIMHSSAAGQYDEICCEFDYEIYDGGWSVGSKFHSMKNGVSVSGFLDDPENIASGLVHQLHDVMKSHTGGDWKRFSISIDQSGRATTQFSY